MMKSRKAVLLMLGLCACVGVLLLVVLPLSGQNDPDVLCGNLLAYVVQDGIQLLHPETQTTTFIALKDDIRDGLVWSPDGRQLAIPGQSALYLFDVDSQTLNPVEQATAEVTGIMWSPDGTRIAYMDNNLLHVLDLKTKRQQTFQPAGYFGIPLAWSPDGRYFVFQSIETPPGQNPGHYYGSAYPLYLLDVQNSYSEMIGVGEDYTPVDWSPDSQTLVFTSVEFTDRGDNSRINHVALYTPPGATSIAVTQELGEGFGASRSPDGKYVAFSSREGIFRLEIATKKRDQLFDRPGYKLLWTNDGGQIAFVAVPPGKTEGVEFYTVNSDGTNLHRAGAVDIGAVRTLTWSPDGQWLTAFFWPRSGTKYGLPPQAEPRLINVKTDTVMPDLPTGTAWQPKVKTCEAST